MTRVVRALRRSPLLLVGTVVVSVFVAVAVLAPLLAPYDPQAITGPAFEHPSSAHLLGTNDAGSDTFSRIVWGTRDTMVVAVATTALVLSLGVAVGVTAALRGGFVDVVLMRVVDLILALPIWPLLIFVAALAKPSRYFSIVVIGVTAWPETARIVRSQALTLRQRGFVGTSRGFGAGPGYVMRRHLLPGLGPIITSNLVYVAGVVVTIHAALAFIGLTQPGAVTWGTELNRALASQQVFIGSVWLWWLLPPSVALTLVILGFTFIGVGLEPEFNPRWRRAR